MTLESLSDALVAALSAAAPSLARVERAPGHPATATAWDGAGLWLTTARAAHRRERLALRLADGTVAAAQIVGRDPGTDLALLRAEAPGAAPAWSEAEVHPGALVLVVGAPGGAARATLGLVSAVGGAWRTPHGAAIDRRLDVDARLPPGFSGGALVAAGGGFLGVNTRGLARGGTTLPTATARRVVAALLADGRVRAGYLGVAAHPVRFPPATAASTGQPGGLLLSWVDPDGPAARAGWLLGDVLLELGGSPVPDLPALRGALDAAVGEALPTRLWRAGGPVLAEVRPGERPGA